MTLSLHGVDAFYGRAQALFAVDLAVAPGEVLAVLGRNGAGKSTLLRAVVGLVARRGRIEIDGRSLDRLPTDAIARAGIGYVPEDRRIFGGLSVEENLAVGRLPPREGAPAWTSETVLTLFPALGPLRRRDGGRLSGGEQQMLAIGRTLMGNPRVLLLDEPSEGLAPKVVAELQALVRRLAEGGLAVVLCEQNLRFARAAADRAAVLETGHLRWAGAMAELAADVAAQRTFLGV